MTQLQNVLFDDSLLLNLNDQRARSIVSSTTNSCIIKGELSVSISV